MGPNIPDETVRTCVKLDRKLLIDLVRYCKWPKSLVAAGDKRKMKATTVALVIKYEGQDPSLIETISDEREIVVLENGFEKGQSGLIEQIHDRRAQQAKEEDDFGNYVEDLLSQPYVRPEIQEHGIQWLKSKIKIDEYNRTEAEAAKIIADYAFKVFTDDPDRTDFFLAGPNAKVRVRIFVLPQDGSASSEKQGGKEKGPRGSRAA
jgi:hypothetical protein